MKVDENIWTYGVSFLAAIIGAIISYLGLKKLDYRLLAIKLLLGCAIAFFIVPYVVEILGVTSERARYFFVFSLSYFSDSTLKIIYDMSISRLEQTHTNNDSINN